MFCGFVKYLHCRTCRLAKEREMPIQMQAMEPAINAHPRQREEYVTIIAPTIGDVMKQFQARGLDVLGYAIMGRIGRHRFAFAQDDQSKEMFEGETMLAATFMRQVPDMLQVPAHC
jgi:hypothetical protein